MAPRTLREALAELDVEGLTHLLSRREDLTRPLPGDLAELAQRALAPTSVARALDRLDAWQRAVAVALAASPEQTSTADVAQLLPGAEPADVAAAVAELRARGLLWGSEQELHLVRAVREVLGPHPGGLAPVSVRPLAEADVAASLAAADEAEHAVLERLLWHRPTGALRHADRAVSLAGAQTPVERLLARGLLRPADTETVVLPREVAWVLRGGRLLAEQPSVHPPELGGRTRPTGLVEQAGVGAAWALVHDVEQLVEGLGRREVSLLRDGGVAARDVTALARSISAEPAQSAVLLEWALAAGLLGADGPRLLPTPGYDRWLPRPGAERWTQLLAGWLRSGRWPRSATRPGAHPLATDQAMRAAVEVRDGVCAVLAEAPVGQQVDADTVLARLTWYHPGWAERLPLVELVDDVLIEAETAGLTALSAVTPLLAVARGAALAPRLAARFPETVDRLVVQADLTAVAPGPLRPEVAAAMRQLGEQESRGGGGVYRFTEVSLRRALDAGWSPGEVERWLGEHSSTGVPQPLLYLLADVARRHGSVQVLPAAAVLRVDDPAQAAHLLQSPAAAGLGLTALAPGVLVATAEPEEVVGALRRLGLAPVGLDASGSRLRSPAPLRARETAEPSTPAEPSEPRRAAELLLQRQAEAQRRRLATGSALDVLQRASAAGTEVVLDWVTTEGGTTSGRARPSRVSAGAVLLTETGTGRRFTVPLARVVAAREDEARESGAPADGA